MEKRLIKEDKVLLNAAVIVIGRNEGERLSQCFKSVKGQVSKIVYVDSGSVDDSILIAHEFGVNVVELDTTIPFTAARARNAGYEQLFGLNLDVEYVQFVDGDCEIVRGWLEAAVRFLENNKKVAVVCGRRKERYPERSVYNMLCDIEWDTPIGETKACGGDAMFRVVSFGEAGGFRDDLIAGEEPELCVRIRTNGWRIWRLDSLMTLHDAAILRFNQWWKRAMRSGYAYAEGAYLHGTSPEYHRVCENLRTWFWGVVLPVLTVILATSSMLWILLLLAYPLQVFRLAIKGKRSTRENWIEALFLMLGKFPEGFGQMKFIFNLTTGKRGDLIEYK